MIPDNPHAGASVESLVTRASASDPAAIAALSPTQSPVITYGQLIASIAALRGVLRDEGVGRSDVVIVNMPNGVAMLSAIVATMCSASAAPMNPAYTLFELEAQAVELSATAIVTLAGRAGVAHEVAEKLGIPIVEVAADGSPIKAPSTRPDASDDVTSPDDVALILHTAGTTARPKQVPLRHRNLAAAAMNVVSSLRLRPEDRCLNVMPLFHSHGLLGAAMSTLASGGSIVCAETIDPRRFVRWAADTEATWYTAAPTIHRLALDAPGAWNGFRFMRSASAPLAPQVAAALESKFDAPMIEVYGMTEAYQIAANPLPPGERRLGSVGISTGTEIRIIGDDGRLVASDIEGEVAVRGPAVFSGYSSPPGANDNAFIDGWFLTGDLGRLSPDGYLTITGRRKEQINRGGEKVSPREVDEALIDHPDVLEAMTFAVPHAALGEEVGAALVVREGATVDLSSVRRFLHGRIAPFKVPSRIVIVDRLPKSSTGKLLRVGFSPEELMATGQLDRAGAHPHGDDRSTSPATRVRGSDVESLEDQLALLWQELLELDHRPHRTDTFFDLGGTSLLTMELVVKAESLFGVDLPLIDVTEVPRLDALARRIGELRENPQLGTLLRPYRVHGDRPPLVLVPGAFGMAVGLFRVADEVGDGADVYLFDYPGHRPGTEPARSIDALATVLIEELEAAGIADGIALYGNSLGSWVVYEVARRLSDRGWPPSLVAIGDMYSPRFAGKDSPLRPPLYRRLLVRARRELNAIRRRARVGRTVTTDVPPAMARQRAVFDASQIARRTYEPRPYAGDVLVFSTPYRNERYGMRLGYERDVSGVVSTVAVSGDHSDMHTEQSPVIGTALANALRARHTGISRE